jgi:hypothetical protein
MATVPVVTGGTASEVTSDKAPEVTNSSIPDITTESKEPDTTHGSTAKITDGTSPEIPKTCKAGVVVNEGPDFKLEVEDVPVPEPGMFRSFKRSHKREC